MVQACSNLFVIGSSISYSCTDSAYGVFQPAPVGRTVLSEFCADQSFNSGPPRKQDLGQRKPNLLKLFLSKLSSLFHYVNEIAPLSLFLRLDR